MNDKDFKQIADLLKLASGICNDGADACERGNDEKLGATLLWAHEVICDAVESFSIASRRKKNDARNCTKLYEEPDETETSEGDE